MRTHIAEAKKAGFSIDGTVYPPVAYKGFRTAPEKAMYCFSHLESGLLDALQEAYDELYRLQTIDADLLVKLKHILERGELP